MKDLCQTNHNRSIAQIESSRACTSRSPIWVWSARSFADLENEEVKVVQELLRHANSRMTLDLYAQAGMPNKRLAQTKLVRMVLNKGEALA